MEYYHEKRMKDAVSKKSLRPLPMIFGMIACMTAFVVYKESSLHYLPVAVIMMFVALTGSLVVDHFHADMKLFDLAVLLIYLGFTVQRIKSHVGFGNGIFVIKLIIALVAAFAAGAFYRYFGEHLKGKKAIFCMMALQYLIGLIMLLTPAMDSATGQGAKNALGSGQTLFEVVKLLYVFTAAGLLSGENIDFFLGSPWIKEIILIVHTGLLIGILTLCSEMGTAMMLFMTGLILFLIFGRYKRKILFLITAGSTAAMALLWFISDRFLFALVDTHAGVLPDLFEKIILRFALVLHPEYDPAGFGFQGVSSLRALTMGGLLGVAKDAERVYVPAASTDFIFTNIVQTCGILMGLITILLFVIYLKRGMDLAETCSDRYSKNVVIGILTVIGVETLISIGSNIGVFPIVGIPMYFLSQGFTAMVTAMVFTAVILVISSETTE